MRLLLSVAISTALLAACGGTKDKIVTDPVDYDKLQNTAQSEAPLTLASKEELGRHIKNGMRLQLKNGPIYLKGGLIEDGEWLSIMPEAAPVADPNEGGSSSSDGFSETNVHVKGVDEADYAKYDGKHWFVATSPNSQAFLIDETGPGFNIVATDPSAPNAEIISNVELDNKDDGHWGNVREMYLVQENGATTHVVTVRNQWGNVRPYLPGVPIRIMGGVAIAEPAIDLVFDEEPTAISVDKTSPVDMIDVIERPYEDPINSRVRVQLIDVQTPESPEQDWELLLDGSLINSRKVGNILYLVTRYDPWIRGLFYDNNDADTREENEAELAEATVEQLLPSYQIGDTKYPLSKSCYLQKNTEEHSGFSSVVNITAVDLSKQEVVSSQCVNGSLESMSMTPNSLYLTGTIYDQKNGTNKTVIHKFSLDGSGPKYEATGSAEGSLGWTSDPAFRMHEYQDTFRIVTSAWGTEGPEHTLTILEPKDQSLNVLSTLPNDEYPEPIGKPREEIYSVRFEGNRAYIVTFRRTDPLYAIDLSDPSNPMIAGELEIPGFATYMHPIGDEYLFTLGRNADEDGRALGIKAELIDVTGKAPRVVNTLFFGGRSTHSEALDDLKALSFKRDDDRLRITVPIVLYLDDSEHNQWLHTGLQLMEVTGLPYLDQKTGIAEKRLAPTEPAQLIDSGTIVSESQSKGQSYPGYSINRSIIHDNAVFYAHNNAIWAADWDDPKGAVGPITSAPVNCLEVASPPALKVLIQLPQGSDQDPCLTEVYAFNNSFGDGSAIALEAHSSGKDGLSCSFSGGDEAGSYTVIAELPGYRGVKNQMIVYRNQCYAIPESLTVNLKAIEDIICTADVRPSLEVYVDIEESAIASACDASVMAVQNGEHYQLDGYPIDFIDSGSGDTGSSGSGEGSSEPGEERVAAKLIAADPAPPRTSTRCVFSGPWELAGEMSLEISLDGYASEAIDSIFVEKDECHVKTQQLKVWMGLLRDKEEVIAE